MFNNINIDSLWKKGFRFASYASFLAATSCTFINVAQLLYAKLGAETLESLNEEADPGIDSIDLLYIQFNFMMNGILSIFASQHPPGEDFGQALGHGGKTILQALLTGIGIYDSIASEGGYNANISRFSSGMVALSGMHELMHHLHLHHRR